MRVSRRQFFGLGGIILALFPWLRRTQVTSRSPIRLRILATTDIHCYLSDYDYYRDEPTDRHGLVRVASLIRAARAESTNTLLFDNGDLLEGNPLSDYIAKEKGLEARAVHPAYKAMNLLRYDAATLGNHDFNYGFQFLERALAGAAFPYVLANVFHQGSGEPYFKPYVILDRTFRDEGGGMVPLRIGVLGLTTPQIEVWARRQLEGIATTVDISATARRLVPEMRQAGAQVVIVLAHTGLGHPPSIEGEENAGYSLAQIDGIDVIVTGHVHRTFPDPYFANLPDYDALRGMVNGRPVSMAGYYGSHLGVMDLTLAFRDGIWRVADAAGTNRPVHGAGLPADRDTVAAIRDDHYATLDYVRRPVGKLAQPLNSYFALVAPNPLLALVADVQLWAAARAMVEEPEAFGNDRDTPLLAAVAPFKAGAGRRGADAYTAIDAGPISLGNVADLYPYPNVLEIVRVNGAGLREWLEMSATLFHQVEDGHDRPQQLIDKPLLDLQLRCDVRRRVPDRRGAAGALSQGRGTGGCRRAPHHRPDVRRQAGAGRPALPGCHQ